MIYELRVKIIITAYFPFSCFLEVKRNISNAKRTIYYLKQREHDITFFYYLISINRVKFYLTTVCNAKAHVRSSQNTMPPVEHNMYQRMKSAEDP